MGREPIPDRTQSLVSAPCGAATTSGINSSFPELFRSRGQVAHVLLTLAPLSIRRSGLHVRLACLIHAASVHSEPGSNSPLQIAGPLPKQRALTQQIKSILSCKENCIQLKFLFGIPPIHRTVQFSKSILMRHRRICNRLTKLHGLSGLSTRFS